MGPQAGGKILAFWCHATVDGLHLAQRNQEDKSLGEEDKSLVEHGSDQRPAQDSAQQLMLHRAQVIQYYTSGILSGSTNQFIGVQTQADKDAQQKKEEEEAKKEKEDAKRKKDAENTAREAREARNSTEGKEEGKEEAEKETDEPEPTKEEISNAVVLTSSFLDTAGASTNGAATPMTTTAAVTPLGTSPGPPLVNLQAVNPFISFVTPSTHPVLGQIQKNNQMVHEAGKAIVGSLAITGDVLPTTAILSGRWGAFQKPTTSLSGLQAQAEKLVYGKAVGRFSNAQTKANQAMEDARSQIFLSDISSTTPGTTAFNYGYDTHNYSTSAFAFI